MTIPNLTILTLQQDNITDFAAARNRLLATAKTDWVLYLDTDETLSPELEKEIKQAVSLSAQAGLPPQAGRKPPMHNAYYIPRQDFFMGRNLKYGETGKISFVRLARKSWGKWQGRVHEKWVGEGSIGQLSSPILHTPHPSLASFVDKINYYSTLAAAERYDQGTKSSMWHIAIYPIAKFKYNYLFRLGILDGVPGLIHAIIMSWHSYLTWAKLYLLWHKK